MAKEFELVWAFEPFEEDPSFVSRHMFGGKAAYVQGKIVMCLAEDRDDPKWYGILFPTEKKYHESLQNEFAPLIPHPILPKWLYLPITCEDFEEIAMVLAHQIAKGDPRLGVYPKPKKKKTKKEN
jgi:hypothetical protein